VPLHRAYPLVLEEHLQVWDLQTRLYSPCLCSVVSSWRCPSNQYRERPPWICGRLVLRAFPQNTVGAYLGFRSSAISIRLRMICLSSLSSIHLPFFESFHIVHAVISRNSVLNMSRRTHFSPVIGEVSPELQLLLPWYELNAELRPSYLDRTYQRYDVPADLT
jgi:hypothetical protein